MQISFPIESLPSKNSFRFVQDVYPPFSFGALAAADVEDSIFSDGKTKIRAVIFPASSARETFDKYREEMALIEEWADKYTGSVVLTPDTVSDMWVFQVPEMTKSIRNFVFPLSESKGLIPALDSYVIKTVCNGDVERAKQIMDSVKYRIGIDELSDKPFIILNPPADASDRE